MASASVHQAVLLSEVLEGLKAARPQPGEFLDCTFGGGGHSEAILQANAQHRVFGVDRDPDAIARSERMRVVYAGRLQVQHGTFADIAQRYVGTQRFDGILADLGFSSDQLEAGRGFSFSKDEALDMRMDPSSGQSAAELLNSASLPQLINILRDGGLPAEARALAQQIVKFRPFHRSAELARACAQLRLPRLAQKHIHPATLVFQAVRIAVNAEFEQLEALLNVVPQLAKASSRVAVISFHSLEDQRVTRIMRSWEGRDQVSASWAGGRPESSPTKGKLLTKKALVPQEAEIERNPRSRSARLRVFEFAADYH